MPAHLTEEESRRRQRIIAGLQGRGLEQATADQGLWMDLQAEALSNQPDKLVSPDLLQLVEQARLSRARGPQLGLFFSTDDVIIVPGFLGSALVDVTGDQGLIWIDPKLVFDARELLFLRLKGFTQGQNDTDADSSVTIQPQGAVPVIYMGLQFDLEVRRYSVQIFGFDWRKGIEESARVLAALIQARANRRFRPLHLVAHSQGSLVARRALQLVGSDLARRLVNNLVLLGPATAGTFAAAFAIAGNHSMLETIRRYGIEMPPGFTEALQSMTGLYQLLPWRAEPVDQLPRDRALDWVKQNRATFAEKPFWKTGVDETRLHAMYGWGQSVDAGFLNDRTTLILGDHPTTGGVKFSDGRLVEDPAFNTTGDGTVPDSLAKVPGVTRVYKARSAEHMMLPATLAVIAAVHDVLAGRPPRIEPAVLGAAAAEIPFLAAPPPPPPPRMPPPVPVGIAAAPPAGKPPAATPGLSPEPSASGDVPEPSHRRLRVFSYDPLFATDLDNLGVEEVILRLPWEFADGDRLEPGPVGEYVEVVDCDPATSCFYLPVDLNHPHLMAQDGMPLSEGDPRFHQQMVYGVAMNTVRHFEMALGRAALWAPHLKRDAGGSVIRGGSLEQEFVQRLRIYPHALRQANAFYDPDKKALLFGYFPAQGSEVGGNLPGGMVFTCLSYDIIAHETTHALLDGLHRYFIEPSNPDAFAFHEGFADIVALFQHFTHPEVLRHEIARSRGDLEGRGMLGVLAAQFGEAQGHRGGLRQYLGGRNDKGEWEPIRPDPAAINRAREPHARGAILVAALFRAFTRIYENRVQDLRRISTNGTGILPDGELQHDLVSRLADEAAKAAGHMLTMCIRALDYIPPVDITFGEYLRALITADYDLVQDDDRRYRVAVVSGFRDWGIYPADVRSLSVSSLLWDSPDSTALRGIKGFFEIQAADDTCWCDQWGLDIGRRAAYTAMRKHSMKLHGWLQNLVRKDLRDPDRVADKQGHWGNSLGLALLPDTAPQSIRRGDDGLPVFEVHSFRPCRRIGPDGQERTDFVVEIVQRRKAFFDAILQTEVDEGRVLYNDAREDFYFRGGCTLIIEPQTGDIRYCVGKSICREERLANERLFREGQFGDKVGGAYASPEEGGNPFAFLHSGF